LLQQSASGLGIDQNLQRHRAVSLRQHGFLVAHLINVNRQRMAGTQATNHASLLATRESQFVTVNSRVWTLEADDKVCYV